MGTDAGGTDAGMSNPCDGATDGSSCGMGMVCMSGSCVPVGMGACGDGTVDDGEECDDGNTTAFDGCEPTTCMFTCSADSACDDGVDCNGVEVCGATSHVCERATPPAPGTACNTATVTDGVCGDTGDGSVCLEAGCGNGVMETGEACDDGNDVMSDGCEIDCTFSCTMDADCDDGNVCNGTESCDTGAHMCARTMALDCTPPTACQESRCDPVDGCLFRLLDADRDGFASDTLGACGTDCNDMDDTVYEGAEELCDGVDNNCNGMSDETAPNWYIDCDGDGYAADTTGSRESCAEPTAPTGCGGGWTSRRPFGPTSIDCDDANPARSPGAMELCNGMDENCDGVADEGAMTTFYLDADRDGHGVALDFVTACAGSGDYDTTLPDDCDDADMTRHPGATEICDNIDQNCDGVRDEDPACGPDCVARSVLGRTYLFCSDFLNWTDAAAACRAAGYRLVAVTSMIENDAVQAVGAVVFSTRDMWWTGLNDQATEGDYEWVDFGPSAYSNWDAGEPMTMAGQSCGVQFRVTGAWGMRRCAAMLMKTRVCEPM